MKILFSRRNPPSRRRAIVTVMVLLVLLLMSALIAEFVRRAVSDRRQTRREHGHQQAIQLADAGIKVLRQNLADNADYAGETWNVPAGILHKTNAGAVEISIKEQTASVTATYPVNSNLPFRVTKTVRLSK